MPLQLVFIFCLITLKIFHGQSASTVATDVDGEILSSINHEFNKNNNVEPSTDFNSYIDSSNETDNKILIENKEPKILPISKENEIINNRVIIQKDNEQMGIKEDVKCHKNVKEYKAKHKTPLNRSVSQSMQSLY